MIIIFNYRQMNMLKESVRQPFGKIKKSRSVWYFLSFRLIWIPKILFDYDVVGYSLVTKFKYQTIGARSRILWHGNFNYRRT